MITKMEWVRVRVWIREDVESGDARGFVLGELGRSAECALVLGLGGGIQSFDYTMGNPRDPRASACN